MIQATVIDTQGMDPGLFYRYATTTFTDPSTMQYFQDKFQTFVNTVANYSQQFADAVANVYQTVASSEVIEKAKSILMQNEYVVRDDIIQCLTIDNIYNAGMTMRQYIIAQPEIFEMYNKNRISGYEDVWEQQEMSIPAEFRKDYLEVVDGVLRPIDDEYGEITFYPFVEKELSIREKHCVMSAWDTALNLIANGIDPTDPNKGEL